MKGHLLLAVLVAVITFPQAGNSADVRQAANNAGHEMIECAAYYAIVAQGFRNTPSKDSVTGAEQYELASKEAIAYALKYAELIGQKPEAVVARMKTSMETLLDKMGKDYVNISILISEYSDVCLKAMEDPAARLEYWISK